MDAARALADLTEISAQIEAAVLAGSDGSVLASTFPEPSRGEELARAASELVAAAGEVADGTAELVQLQAVMPRGSLFVVRDERHLAAAITAPKPTAGLIFYDLKTCLRMLEPKEAKPAKASAAAAEPEPEPEQAAPKETKVGKASGTRKGTTRKKEADEGA
jgi:predicted regulator of Ras-like GTPase activity (Roadblock/LC7/MglB family)